MDMEGLSAICAGLGVVEEDEDGNRIGYSKAEYCLDNLKDLLRFLRRDDPQNRDVFKQVCRWNTVSKDLIPIIEHCEDDRNLVLNAVKVLVFLTMPIEPSSSDISQQIEYLWGLKSSITCSGIVAITVSHLENPLENLEGDAMTEDDWKLVQLILTLFKNLLAIQEISLQQKVGGTASHLLSLRDRFLELLFQENVMELIIVISQHFGGFLRQDNLLLLDIFHYIFLGHEPELVAKAHLKGTKADEGSTASINSLKSLMEEEDANRRLFKARNVVRHSHFVGTFTRLAMDGSKELINGKPSSISRNAPIKQHKYSRGPAKKIAWDHGGLPPSKDKILELLHDFVNQFLSGGYNGLMQSLRDDIEKEHSSIQESDVIVFFQVAQFVTSFQYHKFFTSKLKREADVSEPLDDMQSENTPFIGDVCAPIAATMKDSMFQLVFLNWREKFEGLKETQNFKFISVAGSLMKNMIRMLDLVLNEFPEDSKESQTARILLYKLFYDQTDQGLTQFLLNMIKSFDTHKQTKSDLEDLVEMICKILHLMENLQTRGILRVAKKTRRGKKKKTPVEKEAKSNLVVEQSPVRNEIASSNIDKPAEVDTTPEEGPVEKEANSDHSGERPSVRNEIGSSNTDKPVEVDSAPKETENTSSDEPQETQTVASADNPEEPVLEMDTDPLLEKDHKSSGDAGESSDDDQVPETSEVDFNVTTLVSSLANNSIIQNTCWLLKFYKSNTNNTNDYIIRILRRVCDDLELSPMLYQLSLLTSFYDILAQQKSSPCKEYANIVDFLKRLVRKMFKKMKSQPLLFVETLFWKTRKECHYINAEYLVHELGHYKKDLKNQGKDSEDQGVGSSEAKEWRRVSIADALGDDEADVEIAHDLGNDSDVNVREVKGSTSFISDEDDGEENNLNGHKPNRVPRELGRAGKMKKIPLGPDMDEKIRDLYEKLKDSQDCSRLIAEDLDPDGRVSSLQVSNKLKQLGLISGPRKRIRHVGDTTAFNPDKLEDGNDSETGSMSRSKKARKGVHAFSDDQEATIRDLYEQFKAHKRCSFMIANAMEGDTKFSSAQVTRKLKQLGLYIPHQKRPKTSKHLMDEDLKDNSTDKENESDSDDEPLSSLVHRGRKRENGLFTENIRQKNSAKNISEDDSDNETLASVAKDRKREHAELISEDIRQKSSPKNISEYDSDNETLASVAKGRKWENDGLLFGEDIRQKSSSKNISEDDSDSDPLISVAKKRKRSLSKSKDPKLTKISNDSLENLAEEGIRDGDVGGQSSISEPAEIANVKESTEAKEDLVVGKKPFDGKPPKSPNISPPRDMESDDLEDSGDEEAGHSEPSTASVVNRRRMVVDFEDDDD